MQIFERPARGARTSGFDRSRDSQSRQSEPNVFTPRPGRCGPIFGAVQTERGLEALRWSGEIGIEVIGKQGSGKTRGFVKPSLLIEDVHEDAESWTPAQRKMHPYGYETLKIVLDIKGDLCSSTSGYRASLGEDVFIIDPFSTDKGVAKYNPFDMARIGTEFMFRDYMRLANWVCEDMVKDDPSYWDKTSLEAMAGFMGHLGFMSIVKNDPTLNSPCGLINYISQFKNIDEMIEATLDTEHDPHSVYGWNDENGKPIKKAAWITGVLHVLNGKVFEEKSGIYGSAVQHLTIYRDSALSRNITTSTFRPAELADNPNNSSIIYLKMPAADINQLRPYMRLLVNSLLDQLLPPTETVEGREGRKHLREFGLWFEESAALARMEQIQRAAAYMRGHGGKLITIWQSHNQLINTYGKEETISPNQGLHLYYAPETDDEAERLSKSLGETSFSVTAVNHSGDRMSLGPMGHLSESNQIQTRRNYTTYEVKALPTDELFFFGLGIQGRIHQYHYDKDPTLLKRSQIQPIKESSVKTTRPYCIENLEAEFGAERLTKLLSPAPSPYAENLSKAEERVNGCKVYTWEETADDTGVRTYFAQMWLPGATKPALYDKEGYTSSALRKAGVGNAIKMFEARDDDRIAVAKPTDNVLAAADSVFEATRFEV